MLHIEETHSKIFLIEMSILCLGNFCLLFVTPCTEVVLLLCQTYLKLILYIARSWCDIIRYLSNSLYSLKKSQNPFEQYFTPLPLFGQCPKNSFLKGAFPYASKRSRMFSFVLLGLQPQQRLKDIQSRVILETQLFSESTYLSHKHIMVAYELMRDI